jgi:hypothetical protein
MFAPSLPDASVDATIPSITFKRAVKLITAAADDLLLPFPYAITTMPASNILSLTFWADLDLQLWSDFFGVSVWTGVGATVIVHALDWHGWTVSMQARGPAPVGCTCGGEIVHQVGCPAELVAAPDLPIPYLPVAMPTGVEANRAECERLNAETPRDVALEFSHHRGLSDTYRVRIDTEGRVWILDDYRWVEVGKVDLSHLGVAEIDAHCDAENYLKRQDVVSAEYAEHHAVTFKDVVTVDPDLIDPGRGGAAMARMTPAQAELSGVLDRLEAKAGYVADQERFADAAERLKDWRPEVTPADEAAERLTHALIVTVAGDDMAELPVVKL